MKPRLDTLMRQRELLREHLRWLDDEIAAASASSAERPPHPAAAAATEVSPTASGFDEAMPTLATRGMAFPPRFSAESPAEVAALERVPELDQKSIHDEVKRGCLIYAAIAFAGFAAVIAAAYWMR